MVLFEVIDPTNVTKSLFALGITAITIAPRMPFDESWTIGGNLSRGFRILLLVVTSLNITRYILEDFVLYERLLMAIESVLISFLSLLTPFLLRTWMSERINFPGSDCRDKGLMLWVYLIAGLSMTSVLLYSMFGNMTLWIFKKIGDAVSFIPVYQTMQIYNRMTTVGGSHPGRGTVLAQVVLVGEYYALLSHSSDIFFKVLTLLGVVDEMKIKFVRGLQKHILFAVFTRILCHSIMLNVLDETYHIHVPNTAAEEEKNREEENPKGNIVVEIVPLASID